MTGNAPSKPGSRPKSSAAKGLGPRKGMSAAEIATTIDAILEQATLEEKSAMMAGKGFFALYAASNRRWGSDPYRAGGGCERLGVPPLRLRLRGDCGPRPDTSGACQRGMVLRSEQEPDRCPSTPLMPSQTASLAP